MTKQEMTTLLRSVGVNENTITAMENAYELGAAEAFQAGYEKGVAGFTQAVKLEREACAKVCEGLFDLDDDSCDEAEQCAKAIRNRGEA
jgi:flagellar biosynthesis/type III secretory pathway protein FliH